MTNKPFKLTANEKAQILNQRKDAEAAKKAAEDKKLVEDAYTAANILIERGKALQAYLDTSPSIDNLKQFLEMIRG